MVSKSGASFLQIFYSRNWVVAISSGLIPGLFALLVNNNLFFKWGAYYLDAGVQQYSLCRFQSGAMPPAHQVFWGHESIFYIHGIYSPYLFCNFLRVFVDESVLAYILFNAIQVFLVSVSGYLAFSCNKNRPLLSFIFGNALGFSSFVLGSIGYPHFELFGAGLISIGVWLIFNKSQYLGLLAVFLGCLTKEDFGGHLLLLIAMFLLINHSYRDFQVTFTRKLKLLALVSFFGLVSNVLVSRVFFSADSRLFEMQYLGDPPFSALFQPMEFTRRLSIWLSANPPIVIWVIVLLLGYFTTKSRLYLFLVISGLPWILINLVSPDPAKQTLGIYHGYPFILYICVSLILFTMQNQSDAKVGQFNSSRIDHVLIGVIANALFAVSASLPGGSSYLFFYNLGNSYADSATRSSSFAVVEKISDLMERGNHKVIDDAVASLIPEKDEYILNELVLDSESRIDYVFYFDNYVLGNALRERVKERHQLSLIACFPNTYIRVLTRDTELLKKLPMKTVIC